MMLGLTAICADEAADGKLSNGQLPMMTTADKMACMHAIAGFAGHIHNCSASVGYYTRGQPLRSEDIPFPRPNSWWEEAAAILTMQLVFG
jgi:hypothetical protein